MVSVSDIVRLLESVPLWRRMKDLPARIDEIERRLAEIEGRTASRRAAGDVSCAICGGPMQVTKVDPHPDFGRMGMQELTLRCAAGHVETRLRDPRKE